MGVLGLRGTEGPPLPVLAHPRLSCNDTRGGPAGSHSLGAEWRDLKHKLLEKNESRVKRAELKEKTHFIHVLSRTATHLVCLVLKS